MNWPKRASLKDSGTQWLGEIPRHWPIRPIGFHFAERKTTVSDRDYPPLSVTKGGILPQLETAAKTDNPDARKLVLRGDFVINSRSDRKGSSGVSPQDGSVSAISTVLEPRGIHRQFVHYLFRSEAFQEEYYRFGSGIVSDLWSTRYSAMKQILIPVPPEQEQVAISSFLDHETAKIDALITKQEQLIATLREDRAATITQAVTKGLDPNSQMKATDIGPLPEIPSEWKIAPLKRYGSIRYGIAEPPDYTPTGTPLIRATNVSHGSISTKGIVYVNPCDIPPNRIVRLQTGDIVVVRSGAYTGDSAIITDESSGSIAGFDMVLSINQANPRFLSYALLSSYVKEAQIDIVKMRAAQPHLNAEELGSCYVAVPQRAAEQTAIADFLDLRCTEVDKTIKKSTQMIATLREYRSALITEAVTGKIDVREAV